MTPYRLSGTVRVEGTNQPVAGAKLRVFRLYDLDFENTSHPLVASGPDGRFAALLPAGQFHVEFVEPPIGFYCIAPRLGRSEIFSIGPDDPAMNLDFQVRQGTVWDFQFTRGPESKPCDGFVSVQNGDVATMVEAQADEDGRLRLTLPTEPGTLIFLVRETCGGAGIDTGYLHVQLRCNPGFRVDEVTSIEAGDALGRHQRIIDSRGHSALLATPTQIAPIITRGKLAFRVTTPERGPRDLGAVTGLVLDDNDRPIVGASVGIAANGASVSNELRHQSMTNAQGRYRLRDIPRRGISGQPLPFQIVVIKKGYADHLSRPLPLKDDQAEKLQAVAPIRLKPGIAVSGVVVDHRGDPVAEARISSIRPLRHRGLSEESQTARTDGNGRFTITDLRPGMTRLTVRAGSVGATYSVMAGPAQPALLQLPEERRRDAPLRAAPVRLEPIRLGEAAAEWQVGVWSDGRPHTLLGDRGQAIVLYFWGTDFRQSAQAMPALGKLAARFAPRGVEFLAIHRPDDDEKRARAEAARILSLKQAPLVFALDQARTERSSRGLTAQTYGLINYPTLILIDRAGTVAFRTDMAVGDRNMAAVFLKILTEPQAMTEELANRLAEHAIAEEIEAVLNK